MVVVWELDFLPTARTALHRAALRRHPVRPSSWASPTVVRRPCAAQSSPRAFMRICLTRQTQYAGSAHMARRHAQLQQARRGSTAAAHRIARCRRARHHHALCCSRCTELNATSSLAAVNSRTTLSRNLSARISSRYIAAAQLPRLRPWLAAQAARS